MNVGDAKKLFRKKVRLSILNLSEEQKNNESLEVCGKLKIYFASLPSVQTVAVFSPMNDEINIRPFIQWLFDHGKQVVFPRVHKETHRMDFCAVSEPKADSQIISPSSIDVILVPGLAFDTVGNRLGRGKGYYDSYLSLLPEEKETIGVCFNCQYFDNIPHEDRDVSVKRVVTG